MTAAIKIHDLFQKDIRREINGVIKVDQYDEDSIYTELDEYVVTKETLKHLDIFLRSIFTQCPSLPIRSEYGSQVSLGQVNHILSRCCPTCWKIR